MNKTKLRIAFVTPEYVTERGFGGIGNYLHRTAKALVNMGHEIHVVAISEIDQAEFDHENIRVHRVMSSRALPKVNYLTRYRLATANHFLDRGLQVHRKLKALNARAPLFASAARRQCELPTSCIWEMLKSTHASPERRPCSCRTRKDR